MPEAGKRAMPVAAAQFAGGSPKALVAPHAGYVYSGPVAAAAYASLVDARETVRRVVLLGPAHRMALAGMAISSATAWSWAAWDSCTSVIAIRPTSNRCLACSS